jgi:hypothetical protein
LAGDKRWQAGVVQKRLPGLEYQVKRIFDNELVHVNKDEIRNLHPGAGLRLESIKPGMRMHARFSGDGKYYACTVKSTNEHGALVLFDEYGNEEAVCVEHMKIVVADEAAAGGGGPSSSSQQATSATEQEIPRHLVILPTDTEEVRKQKLKKQKTLAWRAKQEEATKADEAKQNKWLLFQATSKRVKGALTDPSAKSQFSLANGHDVQSKFGTVAKTSSSGNNT